MDLQQLARVAELARVASLVSEFEAMALRAETSCERAVRRSETEAHAAALQGAARPCAETRTSDAERAAEQALTHVRQPEAFLASEAAHPGPAYAVTP